MNNILKTIDAGNNFGKGLFLMVVGILFVFAVQVLFYILIKAACRIQKWHTGEVLSENKKAG
jgi:Na+-transporting methylmalonyl-CoA/oxaloacetate decarboxylase gamma subunit